MAINNIVIDKKTLEEISNEIGDRTAEELKSIGDDQSLLLKKIALRFLESVEQNLEKIKLIEDNAKQLKDKRHALKLKQDQIPQSEEEI